MIKQHTQSPGSPATGDRRQNRPPGKSSVNEQDEIKPFNPLDTSNLANAVAKAMLERPAKRLGNLPTFKGAGIYAIYYSGGHPAYERIVAENLDLQWPKWPIYVGKAIPEGGRRGKNKVSAKETSTLFKRLGEHRESVQATQNLNIDDFSCRFLIVHDLWIPLAEQLLIARFGPVWNSLIDGFGNHDPGKGRHAGLCPRWDVLHPGRPWASKLKPRQETAADIEREVRQHLANASVPSLVVLSMGGAET